jgi:hypothetical protein
LTASRGILALDSVQCLYSIGTQFDLIGTAFDPRREAGGRDAAGVNFMPRLWGAIVRDRRDLVLEHLALRDQLDVLTRNR